MSRLHFIVSTLTVLLLLACNEPFEPKGPYEEQLVVYGLLSTLSDTQYVRLYTTYNPEGFDPFTNPYENQISGATVLLASSQGTFPYRDTSVTRPDKSRYSSDIGSYVLAPFRPTPGMAYSLNVQLPSGKTASGEASVPDHGSVLINTSYVVESPQSYNEDIRLEARISAKTRGLLVRMYLEFEIARDGITELRLVEVPERVRSFGNSELVEPIYPSLKRRESSGAGGVERIEYLSFQREAYLTMLANLTTEYSGWTISRKRAIFVLWQAEPNLYNYYNIVNGFRDDISIRTDEPDYSAINGGLGVFGAMTVDSTFYTFRQ